MSTINPQHDVVTVTRPVAIAAALAIVTALVLAITLPILLSTSETVRVPGTTRVVTVDLDGGARSACVVDPLNGGVGEC